MLFFVYFMVLVGGTGSAEEMMDESTFTITRAVEEIGIEELAEISGGNQDLQDHDLLTMNQPMRSGTGNLTEVIEVNNTAGESVKGYLTIRGDDATIWQYSLNGSNTTGSCYLVAMVQAADASYIMLSTDAVSADMHHSTADTTISSKSLPNHGRCSGYIGMATGVDQNHTYSWGDGSNQTGRIDWFSRSYHEIPADSPAFVSRGAGWPDEDNRTVSARTMRAIGEVPVGLDQDQEISPPDEQSPFFNTYASSDGLVINGNITEIHSYSSSRPEAAVSRQKIARITGGSASLWNLGEDWMPGDDYNPGNAMICSVDASKNSGITYYGEASSSERGSSTEYQTEATAKSVKYSIQSTADRRNEHFTLSALSGGIDGNAGQTPSTRNTIPASFKGSQDGSYSNGTCHVSENISLSGAYITRNVYGGILKREDWLPVSLVEGNISTGSIQDAYGASRLTGVSTLTVQRSDAGQAALKGRWLASAPEKLPITRNLDVITPSHVGYTRSQSLTGLKYIKEEGAFSDGMVHLP